MSGNQPVNFPFQRIWSSKLPSKVNFMIWQAVLGELPTIDVLRRKKLIVNCCYLCGTSPGLYGKKCGSILKSFGLWRGTFRMNFWHGVKRGLSKTRKKSSCFRRQGENGGSANQFLGSYTELCGFPLQPQLYGKHIPSSVGSMITKIYLSEAGGDVALFSTNL